MNVLDDLCLSDELWANLDFTDPSLPQSKPHRRMVCKSVCGTSQQGYIYTYILSAFGGLHEYKVKYYAGTVASPGGLCVDNHVQGSLKGSRMEY